MFSCNIYKATSVNSFLLKQDLKYSIKKILTQKHIKQRKCILCKPWMDAQTYRWEKDECLYWHPAIYQPVPHKTNIRKSTYDDVPHSCTGLQGLLKKGLCSSSGVFVFWHLSLKRCQKSLPDYVYNLLHFLTWESSLVLRGRNFPWKSKGSDSICKQHKTRGKTHTSFCKKPSKNFSVSCDPISQMQRVIPASILNKLLHRHIYHWRRCAQKAAFVTKRAFSRYLQT